MATQKIDDYAIEAIIKAAIDKDEFVSWVANEWLEGYCQSVCNEAETDDGLHYHHARVTINEQHVELIAEYHNR